MEKEGLIRNEFRIFLAVQGLELWAILKKELWASTAGDMGSIPDWASGHVMQPQKNKSSTFVFYLFAALQANKGWRARKGSRIYYAGYTNVGKSSDWRNKFVDASTKTKTSWDCRKKYQDTQPLEVK